MHEGLERLENALQKLSEHNLTLKISKRHFFREKAEYLGREISAEGVRPSKNKIAALLFVHIHETWTT